MWETVCTIQVSKQTLLDLERNKNEKYSLVRNFKNSSEIKLNYYLKGNKSGVIIISCGRIYYEFGTILGKTYVKIYNKLPFVKHSSIGQQNVNTI